MKILLIGDIMIDKNIYTYSNRNCPEKKKIPVCQIISEEYLLGGCANVGVNLVNLGHDVFTLSYIGNDINNNIMINLFNDNNLKTDYLVKLNRPTIIKNRIFLDKTLICRYDNESDIEVDFDFDEEILGNFDMIVISDYKKGTINKNLMNSISNFKSKKNIPIIIDPKPENINYFKNTDLVKANFDEISKIFFELKKEKIDLNEDNLFKSSKLIADNFNIKYLITSLSSEGIYFFDKENRKGIWFNQKIIKPNEVIDVTGAGDIVISVLAHFYSDLEKGCFLANKIAQKSVRHIGVKYIKKEDLLI
jgi:rfaE bifunctional protein kinase chain/domain